MLYYECMYSHSKNQWVDHEDDYRLNVINCRHVFCSKLELVIAAWKQWPMYATHEEDKLFPDRKWSDDFGNTRVIIHDDTKIGLPKASDGDQKQSL